MKSAAYTLRYTLRYTRWQDHALAVLWPPKRRKLKMQQAILDADMDEIRRTTDPIQRDLLLTAFIGPGSAANPPTRAHSFESSTRTRT